MKSQLQNDLLQKDWLLTSENGSSGRRSLDSALGPSITPTPENGSTPVNVSVLIRNFEIHYQISYSQLLGTFKLSHLYVTGNMRIA